MLYAALALIILVFLAIGSLECDTPVCKFVAKIIYRLKTWIYSHR